MMGSDRRTSVLGMSLFILQQAPERHHMALEGAIQQAYLQSEVTLGNHSGGRQSTSQETGSHHSHREVALCCLPQVHTCTRWYTIFSKVPCSEFNSSIVFSNPRTTTLEILGLRSSPVCLSRCCNWLCSRTSFRISDPSRFLPQFTQKSTPER